MKTISDKNLWLINKFISNKDCLAVWSYEYFSVLMKLKTFTLGKKDKAFMKILTPKQNY